MNKSRDSHIELPFVDRAPSPAEVELIRLLLSTYQDGSGMLALASGGTLPGWRDFERSIATALGGVASESKSVFDVVLSPADPGNGVKYGLSCKMRSELNRIDRDGRVTIEVSNSSGAFWSHLAKSGINSQNYRGRPRDVGVGIVDLVESWHSAQSTDYGGEIDISKSSYLVLSWSRAGTYQLHQFRLGIVDASKLAWSVPPNKGPNETKRIIGADKSGVRVEWYGESGGQLKYYPFASEAVWSSERFTLEPLTNARYGLLAKAASYFPSKWKALASG